MPILGACTLVHLEHASAVRATVSLGLAHVSRLSPLVWSEERGQSTVVPRVGCRVTRTAHGGNFRARQRD
eukprot:5925332-Prymnesium_polylepis.1